MSDAADAISGQEAMEEPMTNPDQIVTAYRRHIVARAVAVGVLAVAALFVALPALASGGGEHGEENALTTTIFQAVNLLILLGVLVYYGRKPITDFLADRRANIQSDLQTAADLLTEAEHRNAELQRKLVDLQGEVEEIAESSRRRAEDEAERIIAEANRAAERIRNDASAAVDQELRRAQGELRKEAADLALELAAGILNEQITEGDRERLLDEFITRVEPGGASAPNAPGGTQ